MGRWAFWALVAGVLLVGLVFGVFLSQPYTIRGSVIDPPIPAADFILDSSQGGEFRLSDHQGKFVMIFFGYTTCPDVCPTTLFEMKQVKKGLKENNDAVEFVFITVDPERDSVEQLGRYLQSFDDSFYGLTASEERLSKVWDDYGVYREIQETDSAVGYLVDHTSRLYLVDPNGKLMMTYLFDMSVDDIVADLQHLIRNQ